MNHKGAPTFTAYSAGSHPKLEVHPAALRQIEVAQLPAAGLRSKPWSEFAKPGAPKMDFIFTVCDNAAKETCPVWPGQPITGHWGVPDPAAVEGSPDRNRKSLSRRLYDFGATESVFSSACPSQVSIAWP